MRKYILLLAISISNIYCIEFTPAQKKAIGMQIWQNEAGQKYELLVFWNPKEPFPSLGIGHFIWYPAGHTDIYTQTFPGLLDYFVQKKVKLPAWLIQAHKEGAPWKNYQDFQLHTKDAAVEELRKLLFNTIDLQLDFIIKRLDQAWHHLEQNIDPTNHDRIAHYFKQLSQTPAGLYALIDYLNFKGEGTNPNERYKGKGWGLLQVLQAIPPHTPSDKLVAAFAQAAEDILKERVHNAPANKSHEQQWLAGWQKRITTYTTFKTP